MAFVQMLKYQIDGTNQGENQVWKILPNCDFWKSSGKVLDDYIMELTESYSTSNMLLLVLQEQGYKVYLYNSPYLRILLKELK